MACRKGFPRLKIEDRDTTYVPLHPPQDKGTRMHLFCGIESLKGTGAAAETIQYQYECRQGFGTCADDCNNIADTAQEQTGYQSNYADETPSTYRAIIL